MNLRDPMLLQNSHRAGREWHACKNVGVAHSCAFLFFAYEWGTSTPHTAALLHAQNSVISTQVERPASAFVVACSRQPPTNPGCPIYTTASCRLGGYRAVRDRSPPPAHQFVISTEAERPASALVAARSHPSQHPLRGGPSFAPLRRVGYRAKFDRTLD